MAVLGPIYLRNSTLSTKVSLPVVFPAYKAFYFNETLKAKPAKAYSKQIIIFLKPGKLYPLLNLCW